MNIKQLNEELDKILNEKEEYSKEEKLTALQNINKDKLNVCIQYNGSVCGPYTDYKTFKNMTPE